MSVNKPGIFRLVGRQWGRSAFALLTAMALVASPLLVGVAWALPPVVTITSPTDGTVVSGLVTVSATASGDGSVTKVDFFVDGSTLIGTATSSVFGQLGFHVCRRRVPHHRCNGHG